MKITGFLLVPSLFLAPSAVVVAFAPSILVSKTAYKTGYQHHSCWTRPPWHRVGALSRVNNHCSSSSRSRRSNHNTLPAGNERVWDRLTLNAEIDRRTVPPPFAGARASGFIVAAAAIAAGAFVLLASRAAVGSFRRGVGSYSSSTSAGGSGGAAPVSARERTRSSSSVSPWTRITATKMLGAWRCSGNSNAELIKNLIDSNLVRSPRVAKALQATDRGFYAGQDAYEDRPQPIGFRATISAPHMHAHALEVLSPAIPREGGKVLDVGCGSGYLTGALARLVGVDGVVFGMDYIPDLVALSRANLDKDDASLLASGKVHLKTGDGWKGWPENGPFDAIHVGAAAETIPEDLVSQLKVGGRMVVPVGPQSSSQMLVQVDRIKDTGPISESYTTEGLMAVVYVPLVNT